MKQLLTMIIGIAAVMGFASATLMLETDPSQNTMKPNVTATGNTQKPLPILNIKRIPRPYIRDVLQRGRPTLPKPAGNTTNTGNVNTGSTLSGTIIPPPVTTGQNTGVSTGSQNTGNQTVGQQNAADIQAYREEKAYILSYLKKPSTAAERNELNSSVTNAIKTLIEAEKVMRQSYDAAAKTTTLMTEASWDIQAENVVKNYRAALLSYIENNKLDVFEKFILGRTNLLKGMFEKLETIRKVQSQ